MLEKFGPAVCWALYLAICRMAAPEVLPFMFWVAITLGTIYILYVGWAQQVEHGPSHWSPTRGAQCYGVPVYLEHRKFWLDNEEMMETTKVCRLCGMLFFEKHSLERTSAK